MRSIWLPVVVVLAITTMAFVLSNRQRPADQKDSDHRSPDSPAPPVTFLARGEATDWQRLDDPHGDGWTSEAFSQIASQQLERFATWMLSRTPQAAALELLADATVQSTPLLPSQLQTVYQDRVIQVQRSALALHSGRPAHQGHAGLLEAVKPIRELCASDQLARAQFKLYRVQADGSEVTTEQYLSVAAHTPRGAWEAHADWTIQWHWTAGGPPPRILRIELQRYEQASVRESQKTLFADCTQSVLGGNASYRQQMLRGFQHWLQSSQDDQYNFLLGNPGLALGDVNNDGLEDLYVCQEEGLPNRLYLQQPDGTAKDISTAAGVDWIDNSKCSLLVDLDNDGDQDLAVALNGGVALASNNGQGEFELQTVIDTSDDILSLSAADYDSDGRLDLYVGVYHQGPEAHQERSAAIAAASPGVVYHDANQGGPNSLWRNEIEPAHNWKFTEVTQAVGLDHNNRRFTLASAWDDFDNDGDQDLYVANDFGRNNLYRNDGPTASGHQFTDVAATTGTEDSASGMSVSWGDYDRDGWMDLYIGNMFSAAGNRIAFQQQFMPGARDEVRHRIQRFARGNTLLRNQGPAAPFADVSLQSGVTLGRWSWGSNFVDLNNDGWDDVVVANGYITTEDTGDL